MQASSRLLGSVARDARRACCADGGQDGPGRRPAAGGCAVVRGAVEAGVEGPVPHPCGGQAQGLQYDPCLPAPDSVAHDQLHQCPGGHQLRADHRVVCLQAEIIQHPESFVELDPEMAYTLLDLKRAVKQPSLPLPS